MEWRSFKASDCPLRRSDLRQIAKAFRRGWITHPADRAHLIGLLERTALHPRASGRAVLAAFEGLRAARVPLTHFGERSLAGE